MPVIDDSAIAAAITLTEAKAQCRISGTDEDTHLGELIAAATEACEAETGLVLIQRTLRLELDAWPFYPHESGLDRVAIWLPRAPVQSITTFTYVDTAGTTVELVDGTDYEMQIAKRITKLVPAYGQSWPAIRSGLPGAIKVTFVAGYGEETTDIPAMLRHGIRMRLASYYRNAEDEVTGVSVAKFEESSRSIFDKFGLSFLGEK